jgi:hypothetical protein
LQETVVNFSLIGWWKGGEPLGNLVLSRQLGVVEEIPYSHVYHIKRINGKKILDRPISLIYDKYAVRKGSA